ncbi:unnamed protein product [Linum tenue]|uniref:Uncharacterized protein n=1 Tax=Linum tenue TaxID=586396 RepID=A0AAV0PG64_9ROSI|nr:unnamed protein product [Linum tenue]CAI0472236.1 unnamed protein product [Linum tenue]
MSVIDLITRVDSICRKFDKYDVDKQAELNVSGDDAFARLYAVVEAELDSTIEKAESVASAKNRAAVVAINAEIRRTKARLLDEIPKLQRLAMKKVSFLISLFDSFPPLSFGSVPVMRWFCLVRGKMKGEKEKLLLFLVLSLLSVT